MKKLFTILMSLLLLGSPMGVFAQSSSYPATLAFVGPTNNKVAVNTNFNVSITVNTGGQDVSVVDARVKFNSTELEYVTVSYPETDPTFLPSIFRKTSGPIINEDGDTTELVMARYKEAGGDATNGTGTFAILTFKPLGEIGDTTKLEFTFDGLGESVDSNIVADGASTDLLGTPNSLTLTVAAATDDPVGDSPVIDSISPSRGSKDVSQEVTIYGEHFGSFVSGSSKVYLGTKLMEIVDWNDTAIVIQVPAEPDLTQNSTRQVKVHRADGEEDTYTGYTYTVSTTLPNNGPEDFIWAGILLAALGLSILTYRKLSYVGNVQTSLSTQQLHDLSPQDTTEDSNIIYRF
ncbi:MAG: IPT/TIG domain-containing protein [Patescibacteria group bacterium]|nr:IPT/TIG domain-containing protein [Patescibacteria group bacterium]